MNPVSENARVLVLGGLLLVACGGGLSQEDYASSYGEAMCHRQARCGEIRDEDACVRHTREFQRAHVEGGRPAYFQYEGSIHADRLRFDEDAAADCVQHLRDSSCDESLPPARNGDICDVLEGQQKDGEPCLLTQECGKASYCERTEEAACIVGTCKPRPGLGQRVTGSQECAPGLVQVGDTCRELSGEGGACASDSVCSPGLYCASSTRECRRFAREGERCGDDVARCLPHLRCGEGSCQRLADVGVDCAPPQVGPDGRIPLECKRDLFCEGGDGTRLGTCRERLGLGETCSGDACQGSLFCSPPDSSGNGSCQPPRQVGESCASLPCVSGAYCDEGSHTCLRQGGLGESCDSTLSSSCIPGLACRNGMCEADFGGSCEQPRR